MPIETKKKDKPDLIDTVRKDGKVNAIAIAWILIKLYLLLITLLINNERIESDNTNKKFIVVHKSCPLKLNIFPIKLAIRVKSGSHGEN